ncbi:right-handed parallel beta-helix repeat-containing protein [Actinospica sp. MGRD01-02]|uniref:Right-handed parallel beta-helix repeat-containing protein n=1 Tax=Actinospica acidithermotolerans TaxID=2828514 RepID=A0A941EBR1_9ACTN|nr:right-handed parallel beta-helix repeat-containing protein [Actinospica acidithermotolerans]MBR7826119.1 right-handed parallel beta-helix repeat-containing protein [Actinospica acidithermotolerans]
MRRTGGVAAVALLISVGSLVVPAAAHAASDTTFYVDDHNAAVTCSDSTSDSAVTPYCTIQAAVDVATSPGDTVIVAGGNYRWFSVTASGTAAAPITIEGAGGSMAAFVGAGGATNTVPAIAVSGASYVVVKNLSVEAEDNASAVAISNSSHITLDSSTIWQTNFSVGTADPSISVNSGSTAITISRNRITADYSTGAIGVQGGSGDVITTNAVFDSRQGPAITLNQAPDSDVTSNGVANSCGQAVAVTNGSTSASIENNLLQAMTGTSTSAGSCDISGSAASTVLVDGTSTVGSVADYNDVSSPQGASTLYSWAGVAYPSLSALSTATGQGAHDLDNTSRNLIDDANSDAPGELTTDINGNPRVDDPNIANTGAGTYSYYDRGATETEDPISVATAANWPTLMPSGSAGTFTAAVSDGWSDTAITGCVYDFGDGTGTTSVSPAGGNCTAQHTYGEGASSRTIKLTVVASDGYSTTKTSSVALGVGGDLVASLDVGRAGARTVDVTNVGSHGWNLVTCTFNFGDGTEQTVQGGGCGIGTDYSHFYQNVGTYTVTVTVTDSDGQVATSSGNFTATGDFYTPLTSPVRVLDTRHATGVPTAAKVPSGGTIRLKLAGADSVPTDAAAVVLNVTETNSTGGGFITVYPGLTTVPTSSSLNFGAGQTVANTVIVKLGTDGTINLRNSSTGSIDLIADLEGYYAVDGSSFISSSPVRELDTRATHTTLKAGATVKVNLGIGIPATTAATLNITATNATRGGNITAFADDVSEPSSSNLNFGPGQTVANEAVVHVGADGGVELENNSPGTVDLIVDFTGSFSSGPTVGFAYVPIDPVRVLDTRQPAAQLSVGGKMVSGALPADTTGMLEFPGAPPFGGPATPRAIAANVTVTRPTAGGYIVTYPDDISGVPNSSTLNFGKGSTVANATNVAIAQAAVNGIDLYNGSPGSVQLVVDVDGYYA